MHCQPCRAAAAIRVASVEEKGGSGSRAETMRSIDQRACYLCTLRVSYRSKHFPDLVYSTRTTSLRGRNRSGRYLILSTKGPSEVFCNAWRVPLYYHDAIVLGFVSILDHIASLKRAQPHSHLGIQFVTVIRAIAACTYVITQDGLGVTNNPWRRTVR